MPTTTNFGWTTPADTDLVKDGAAAIRTLGNGIDTSFIDLKGGTTGQVLSKASNTDLDFSWVAQDDSNAIQNAIVDAKGDLISATAADTPARLAVGTNGQVLTADSTTSTGLKWATPASGGKVLQVVQATYAVETTSTTATFIDTGLSGTITPTLATSKILVMVNHFTIGCYGSGSPIGNLQLFRGATQILDGSVPQRFGRASGNGVDAQCFNYVYLDDPATTSATTYKTKFCNEAAAGTAVVQRYGTAATIILMEIGA
jgi:hypothetical protein